MDILAPLSGESTLEIVLQNRETRVARQRALLEKYGLPLLSFTVNMPGGVKDNLAARTVFMEGERLLVELFHDHEWDSPGRAVTSGPAGPELVISVATDAKLLKKHVTRLEERSPLGRLFDMDVLDAQGNSISRTAIGLLPRPCLLCDAPAKECARSRRHGLEAVLEKIREITAPYVIPQ